MKDVVENIIDKMARLLPESTVLEYLLSVNATVLMSVEDYLQTYSTVPLINIYQGNGRMVAIFSFLAYKEQHTWVGGWIAEAMIVE